MKAREKDIDRLFANLRLGKLSDCWPWTGARQRGRYGVITIQGRTYRTHRVMYAVIKDWDLTFDPKLKIRHRCNYEPCGNFTHLCEGTHTDNMRDRSRFVAETIPCKLGHSRKINNEGRVFCPTCFVYGPPGVDKAKSSKYKWDSSKQLYVAINEKMYGTMEVHKEEKILYDTDAKN